MHGGSHRPSGLRLVYPKLAERGSLLAAMRPGGSGWKFITGLYCCNTLAKMITCPLSLGEVSYGRIGVSPAALSHLDIPG
jgi:hypothetical protein